jgi:hypothetical protein
VRDLRRAMDGAERAYFVAPHGPNGLHASKPSSKPSRRSASGCCIQVTPL